MHRKLCCNEQHDTAHFTEEKIINKQEEDTSCMDAYMYGCIESARMRA